jgi:hypothetical protein
MPNAVTYSDEKTLPKVYKALFGNNDLAFEQVQGAIDRLQEAGILFREDVPVELRAARRSVTELQQASADSLPTPDEPAQDSPPIPQ